MSDTEDVYALYGVAKPKQVDYDALLNFGEQDIRPIATKTLEQLEENMKAWGRIVREGKSLAAHFGMLDSDKGGTDWAGAARMAMTDDQREMFDLWSKHKKLPPWLGDTGFKARAGAIPSGPDALKKAKQRDEERCLALARLYKKTKVTPTELWQWEAQYAPFIPLMLAVVKLDTARKGASSGTNQDPNEHREYLAAKACVAVKGRIVQEITEQVNRMTRRTAEAIAPVQTRLRAVDVGKKEENKKLDPRGDALALLGATAIGKPANYDIPRTGGRIARQQDFGMGALGLGSSSKRKEPPAPPAAGASRKRRAVPPRGPGGKFLAQGKGKGPASISVEEDEDGGLARARNAAMASLFAPAAEEQEDEDME